MLVGAGREAAEQRATAATRELAQTYEAHTLRALREIDHTLRTVKYAYERVDGTGTLEELQRHGLLLPQLLFEVGIADESGHVATSTHPTEQTDVAGEAFFTQLRSGEELFIAQLDQAGHGPAKLIFSRRLEDAGGAFAGVVFIAAEASYFVSSYDAAALGQHGLLALIGNDRVVRARRSGDAFAAGGILEPVREEADADSSDIAVAIREAPFDGVVRYLSSRKLTGFPITVLVGLSREEQLSAVDASIRPYIVGAVLATLLVGIVQAALGRMSWKLVQSRSREQQTRLAAARESGMAEIATNVLHNVGNALNSVNVSATLVSDSVRQSKSAGLTRVVELLREHRTTLGEFLANDPKGKNLLPYLEQLDRALQADRTACITQLASLQQSIDHIKKIVIMQQMLAKPCAVKEEVDLVQLMEASLEMNMDALGRHSVAVIRDFEDALPPVVLDKHGILQILVNLISNAKHACSESKRADRSITLRVRRRLQCFELSVEDNGVGIPAENLTRIFQHGFTTRANGHGFGLHSSALTARELGGTLQAHSDGIGFGATFTLTVPLEPAQAAA